MPPPATVLVIDDDFDFVEFARIVLESGGYEVHAAGRAPEGLALMRRIQPDVVLLDAVMSYTFNGLNVSREIRCDPQLKGIPLILISAILTDNDLEPLQDHKDGPAYDLFMSKPIEPTDLLEQIRHFVSQRGPDRGTSCERSC